MNRLLSFVRFFTISLCLLNACGTSDPVQPVKHGCEDALKDMYVSPPTQFVLNVDGSQIAEDIPQFDPTQMVDVFIEGALPGTRILLRGPISSITKEAPKADLGVLTENGLSVQMPRQSGSYTIVRVDGVAEDHLGFLEVVTIPVALCATDELEPTGILNFSWRGTGLAGDKIVLFDPVHKKQIFEQPAEAKIFKVTSGLHPMPEEPGFYELQMQNSDSILVRINVLSWYARDRPMLRAPDFIRPNDEVHVQWVGRALPNHLFRILTLEGEELTSSEPSNSAFGPQTGELTAPRSLGRYRIEYSANIERPAQSRILEVAMRK